MHTTLLIALVICGAAVTPASSVRIVVVPPENGIVERAADIAERQITSRSDVRVVRTGEADFSLTLDVDPALPREGYAIADAPDGGVAIRGAEARAVLYGLGKFLRTSTYTATGFTPSTWRGHSAPDGSFRAIYAATHFNNYYEAAPADEVSRYLEDLSLWGANAVVLHFPTWSFTGYDDPAARRNLEQIRRLLETAESIGLMTGLVQCPNQGFASAPPETRAVPNPDPTQRRGNTGINCCPSLPAGKAYLLDVYAKLFDELKDTGLDYLVSWPYDEGGCACAACAPWGAKAFPALSKEVAQLGRAAFPELKVILSTWVYDMPPEGEWDGLKTFVEADPGWLDAIMSDAHLDFPRYPLEHGVPAGLPLLNFPEISMWGRGPWGGYGANPLPARYEALWRQVSGKVSGGMPYSEGIFEDINKAFCFQFYWDRDTSAEATLREYAAYEFAPQAVDDVVEAVRLLEAAWLERGPKSQEAFARLQNADAILSPQARTAWRWRILYLRGLIDSELVTNGGTMEGETLKAAFDELRTIYHAHNAGASVRPPVIP